MSLQKQMLKGKPSGHPSKIWHFDLVSNKDNKKIKLIDYDFVGAKNSSAITST